MSVEALVVAHLKAVLDVPVSASVPKDRPARFVTVERTGGPQTQFLDNPQFAIQAWDTSVSNAADLAGEVRRALPGLLNISQVAKVNIGSTYNYPDPDSRQARYQTTCELAVKIEY